MDGWLYIYLVESLFFNVLGLLFVLEEMFLFLGIVDFMIINRLILIFNLCIFLVKRFIVFYFDKVKCLYI